MKCSKNVFIHINEKFKAFFSSYECFAIFPAPSVVQLRIPISILDLEEGGAELGTGLFRLMLHEVVLVMAGDGFSSCPLADDLISTSL